MTRHLMIIFLFLAMQPLQGMDFLHKFFYKKQVITQKNQVDISDKTFQQLFPQDILLHILSFAPMNEFVLQQIYFRTINKNIAEHVMNEFYQKASVLANYQLYDLKDRYTDRIPFDETFIKKKEEFLKKIQHAFESCSKENKEILNQAFAEKVRLTLKTILLFSLDYDRSKLAQFIIPTASRTLTENIKLVITAASRTRQGNIPTITFNDCVNHKLLPKLLSSDPQCLIDSPTNSPFVQLNFNNKSGLEPTIERLVDQFAYNNYIEYLMKKAAYEQRIKKRINRQNDNSYSDSDDHSS